MPSLFSLWFVIGSPPCLPQELGHVPTPAAAVALLPPPAPPPAPPATAALDETMSFDVAYSLLGKLWILAVEPARATNRDGKPALALAGHAEQIYWDGSADKERESRDFTFWLAADPLRTPLRLVVPLQVGEVRVSLARIDRTQSA